MAKRRKIRPDRILILALLLVLIVLLVIIGVKTLFSKDTNYDETNNEVISSDDKGFELGNYEVYTKDDNLGFGFVVADIKFTSENEINFDLANLITDEGIKLSEIYNYENKLKTSNYDFDALNTFSGIVNGDKEVSVKVFIPFVNKTDSLNIIDNSSNYSILINLTKNTKSIETIKKENKEDEIVSKDYTFTCQKPYIEDMMKHNGEPYDSSMLSIYVFRLTCESIDNGVKVNSATFSDKDGNVFNAYDETYSSSKIDNIIGKTLKVGDTYGLFFELYSNEEDRVAYEGTINLKFSDGTSADVKTILN